MPAQLVRLDSPAAPSDQPTSHSRWSPARVYPDPSSIPPHWYVYPAHQQQPRDPRPPLPPGSLPQTSPTQQPPWSRAYLPGGYARLMQVQPFLSMPPPPIPHKVWILDCKACGTFLTNRGMKVSLFLRPRYRPSCAPSAHTPLRMPFFGSQLVVSFLFLCTRNKKVSVHTHALAAPLLPY
ncbi:hypothetical protein BN946_scf184871.g7 [Trametes cinnabarina]|uniref:Uncharacterized protein n=1 Tax=Pycnoporus cinnabarinus TaxID=5643 RepID=A0A060SMV8_PYCCI|nr:hypothetical protein BN946_scf184871.g7 [Trametes cinnabarina]